MVDTPEPDTRSIVEVVPDSLHEERLDRFVCLLAEMSRSQAATLISAGAVTVDGKPATTRSLRLAAGQQVTLVVASAAAEVVLEGEPEVEFGVVYSDDEVIVVDKPAGLVVHPGHGNPTGTLANGLVARFGDVVGVGQPDRPGIVHRLDVGTSGLLVVARTERAYTSLVGQLAEHAVTRRYLALVWGRPSPDNGVIDAPLGRSARQPTRMAVVTSGRHARTHYSVDRSWDDPAVSQVTCELETGRTHQIRVHLQAIGTPVVGDDRYGAGRSGLGLSRPFLHAAALRFDHPATGERVSFASPLPDELVSLIASLDSAD